MLPSKIGPITQYVNDFSGVISSEKLSELNQLFQQIESKNLAVKQVVTVIFPHREGKELLDIGIELFNNTGIGEKGVNNGLLLLISSEEKKLRIIVGKGLEFIYTEDWCRDVIENHLRPLLDAGKYAELVEKLENIISKKGNKKQVRAYNKKTPKQFKELNDVAHFFIILIMFPFLGGFLATISVIFGAIVMLLIQKEIIFFGYGLLSIIFVFFNILFFSYHFYKKI